MLTKTTSAKYIVKFLNSYFRSYSTIRTDHAVGFKSVLISDFCKVRGIKHILTTVGDHRSCGLAERSTVNIKRKLATEKLDPIFENLKLILQQIIDDIGKKTTLF